MLGYNQEPTFDTHPTIEAWPLMTHEIYQKLDELCQQGEKSAALQALIQHLEQSGQFHELFEALKMKLRFELGLPAAQAEQEAPLDDQTENRLEFGLIAACRQVGEAFLRAGRIREGWMYLRPVGDRQAAANAFAAVEPTDENFEDLINVQLHEGVDIARGYGLALSRLGTCNSVTMFEQALASRPRADQQIAADLLVRHVHRELLANLIRDIEHREGKSPEEKTIEALIQKRPELLKDGSYHLDTSHIAATVRFARVLDNPESLQLALDLAMYGRKLHPQYQYPGEEPFLDHYPASIAFFRALLGQQVDAGIRYFTQKADTVDQEQFGLIAVEVLIDLLSRCGRQQEAISTYAKRVTTGARTMGISPSLLQLSQRLGKFDSMLEICKQRDDLLGYAAARLRDN
jgi:hypothetical protein